MNKKNSFVALKQSLALYGITDRSWLARPFLSDDTDGGDQLATAVAECIMGGTTMIQLREKNISHARLVKIGYQIQAVCHQYNIPFIINDDIEAVLELNADGVHVGQSDCEAAIVRERIGPDKILGVSVQTPFQALKAQKEGADYLGTGAVFTTATKIDADVVTPEQLSTVCNVVDIPVVAIGGITVERLPLLLGTGIAGISVVSALFAADDKKKAAELLCSACKKYGLL